MKKVSKLKQLELEVEVLKTKIMKLQPETGFDTHKEIPPKQNYISANYVSPQHFCLCDNCRNNPQLNQFRSCHCTLLYQPNTTCYNFK